MRTLSTLMYNMNIYKGLNEVGICLENPIKLSIKKNEQTTNLKSLVIFIYIYKYIKRNGKISLCMYHFSIAGYSAYVYSKMQLAIYNKAHKILREYTELLLNNIIVIQEL